MKNKVNKTLKILSALSNEHRLKVFLLLLKEELCVCELEKILNMKQSRISHIMGKLSHAGLVKSKRQGKWVIYSVNPEAEKESVVKALAKDLYLEDKYLRKVKEVKKNGPRSEKCC